MTNWEKIITLANSDQEGASKAMALMFDDADCRKKAYYLYRKYANILPDTIQWESDILAEITIRFTKMVRSGKIPDSGDAVFWRIGKLCCLEFMRKKNPVVYSFSEQTDMRLEETIAPEDDHYVWCKSKLMHYVDKLSPQYKKLILLMYFNKPPEENLDVIAQNLGIDKKAVQPMAWSCRKKLAEFISHNLDDCEESLFRYGIN